MTVWPSWKAAAVSVTNLSVMAWEAEQWGGGKVSRNHLNSNMHICNTELFTHRLGCQTHEAVWELHKDAIGHDVLDPANQLHSNCDLREVLSNQSLLQCPPHSRFLSERLWKRIQLRKTWLFNHHEQNRVEVNFSVVIRFTQHQQTIKKNRIQFACYCWSRRGSRCRLPPAGCPTAEGSWTCDQRGAWWVVWLVCHQAGWKPPDRWLTSSAPWLPAATLNRDMM